MGTGPVELARRDHGTIQEVLIFHRQVLPGNVDLDLSLALAANTPTLQGMIPFSAPRS